jgi:hypothetical protein
VVNDDVAEKSANPNNGVDEIEWGLLFYFHFAIKAFSQFQFFFIAI